MRAGDLRHRLTFQAKTIAQNGTTGAVSETWADSFTAWGSIEPLTGRELLAAQQINSAVTHTVTVRYRSELANPQKVAAMRVLYGSRVFNIRASMNEDERNRMITLQVEEGLTHG